MAERISRQLLAEQAIIHDGPVVRGPTTVDRNFELPTGLYVAMAGLFAGAVGVMALGFAAPALILPVAVIAVFLAMAFALPAMWVGMKPADSRSALGWNRFRQQGIMTACGHATANAATIQVLILPVLILLWGCAVVAIAAVVG